MIVLTIPKPTPSLNVLLRGHWAKNRKLRKEWGWLVRQARLRSSIHMPPKWTRARITIERYGARILDADNFRGGTKFLTDSLVAEEIIADDSPAVIGEPTLRQFVEGKRRETIVRIEAA